MWRARKADLPDAVREVALKVVASARALEPGVERRFRAEISVVLRLDHPNIVPVLDAGVADGQLFFTMKLLRGGTLADQPRRSPQAHALTMVRVARAVAYAHERGVLHRDLKPANILLDEAGEPFVADFGLARLLESPAGSEAITRSREIPGTPAFMAPEQAEGGALLTTAVDVYGLGGVLYFLLSGRAPAAGSSHAEILRAVAEQEPVRPSSLHGGVPRDLEIIALKCLEKRPAARYASAGALADDLERWLRGEPIRARAVSRTERLWRWTRRRPAVAALIILAAVSAAAIFVQQVVSERRLREESEAAHKAETAALTAAAQLRLNFYASDMALAIRAVEEGNLTVARRILQSQIPAEGAEDYRGFEWHWLQRSAAEDTAKILSGNTGAVHAVAFSPDGKLLAGGGRDGFVRLWTFPEGSFVRSFPSPEEADGKNVAALVQRIQLSAVLRRFPELMQQIRDDPAQLSPITAPLAPGYLSPVNTLSFSPDGKLLAAGSEVNAKVWDVPTGAMRHVLPLERAMATFSPADGRLFIVSGYDRTLHRGTGAISVWKLPEEERVAGDFGQSSVPLSFLREGQFYFGGWQEQGAWQRSVSDRSFFAQSDISKGYTLLAGATAEDGSAGATTDTRGPEIQVTFDGAERWTPLSCGRATVHSLAFSPDGKTLAAACDDSNIRLWDSDLRARPALHGHEGAVRMAVFSPDGKWIASAGADHTVRVWSRSPPPDESLYPQVNTFIFTHPSGRVLGYALYGTWLWHGAQSAVLNRPGEAPAQGLRRQTPLGWNGDGSEAAVLRYHSPENSEHRGEASLEWFRTEDGGHVHSIPLGPQLHQYGAALSTNGTRLLRSAPHRPFHDGCVLELRDARSGSILRSAELQDFRQLTYGRFSPDGRTVLAEDGGSKLVALTVPDLRELWRLDGEVFAPPVFSADNAVVFCGLGDRIRLLRAGTGTMLAELSGHTGTVEFLALHPDGRTLASTAADRTLRLWHLPTFRELGILHTTTDQPLSGLTFSNDGRTLIAGRPRGPALVLRAQD